MVINTEKVDWKWSLLIHFFIDDGKVHFVKS